MNFDIDQLPESTEKTYCVTVGHNPAVGDEPAEPVGFIVVGPNSPQYQAAERAVTVHGVMVAEKRKVPLDLSRAVDAAALVDGLGETRDITLEHCVVGWFGFKQGDGYAEFNAENLKKVLRSRPQWAKRLVAEIENAANFDAA